MEISMLGSSAAAPFGPFSFLHIPGQRGKKSVASCPAAAGQLSVVSSQLSVGNS
jgi:hypothetical protein